MVDTVVFNQFAYHAASLSVKQNFDLFNEKSAGGIILTSDYNIGHTSTDVMFKDIAQFIERRDINRKGEVDVVPLTQLQTSSVKVHAGTKPVEITPSHLSLIQMDAEDAGRAFGVQLAAGMPAEMLNAGISAMVACCKQGGADNTYITSTEPLSQELLNTGAFLMGDAALNLTVWVIHSQGVRALFGEAISNTFRLHQFGSVRLMSDPFGRMFIMTDSPSLVGPDGTYRTLGLTPGAISIEENNDFLSSIVENNTGENIKQILRAQWSYNVGVKNFNWASGEQSPNDSALASAANWAMSSDSVKDSAGVMIEHK